MKKTNINIEELARQLEIDLKNIDIKSLARSAKRKANEKARRMYPEASPLTKLGSREPRLRFVADTNIFISAVMAGENTRTLQLLLKLLWDNNIELVAGTPLLIELEEIGQVFQQPLPKEVYNTLLSKTRRIDPSPESVQICKPYFPGSEASDMVHAATCLEAEATLITNDRHFDRIRDAGLIRVWSIQDAIEKLILTKR